MTTTERNACPACGQNTEYESAADLLIIQIGDGIRFHDPHDQSGTRERLIP